MRILLLYFVFILVYFLFVCGVCLISIFLLHFLGGIPWGAATFIGTLIGLFIVSVLSAIPSRKQRERGNEKEEKGTEATEADL